MNTTIAAGVVIALIIAAILFVGARSPSAQGALAGSFGIPTEAARDYTAQDTSAVIGSVSGAVSSIADLIGSIYGSGAISAASGTSATAGRK